MLNSKGFDMWADGYDKSVNLSEERDEYPFAGYKDVLNYIYNEVRGKPGARVLDIGFGTGILTTKLYNSGCIITGIDFSSNMIEIAKEKMPGAELMKWDFSEGLPEEIKSSRYDFIISTYAIHHLTDKEKINFITSCFELLNEKGRILIGDVSFETRNHLDECKEKYSQYWDNDEIYFTADEIIDEFGNDYSCIYKKISHCAGVLTIAKK